MDANGTGLICETEADTVSTAIGTDYGHWSDTLRKSFDHERLAYNRRTNHEYRECKRSYLSILLSGTPAQVKPLIPSTENGLFSRQVFYCMPPIDEWTDQFNLSETDYDSVFNLWGQHWKKFLDNLSVPRKQHLPGTVTATDPYVQPPSFPSFRESRRPPTAAP